MRRTVLTVFFLFVILGAASFAGAQDEHGYIEIGGLWSNQPAGDPRGSPDFPRSGVGGTAFGISGQFTRLLTPKFGIVFAASVPFRFESLQETDYFLSFKTENRHRDIILSALAELRLPPTGQVQVALVGGWSVIREDTLQRQADQTSPGFQPPLTFGPFGPESTLGRWTGGLTGGVDAAIRIGRRVQIVPELRLHWISRAAPDQVCDTACLNSYALSLSSIAVRPALTLRAGF